MCSSVLKVFNISILIIINTVNSFETYNYEDDFTQPRQKITPRLFDIRKTNARQLFYQDFVANSNRPLNMRPNQDAYRQTPYQFQYFVSTGVVSGYSKGGGSFSHQEERTSKQVTLSIHEDQTIKNVFPKYLHRQPLDLINLLSQIEQQ